MGSGDPQRAPLDAARGTGGAREGRQPIDPPGTLIQYSRHGSILHCALECPRSRQRRLLRQLFPTRMTRFFLCLVLVLSVACGAWAAPEAGAGAKDKITVDEKTEAVIKGALKWLASKQLPNGAWGTSGEEQRYPIAITGYTLMAFGAGGQLPGEGEFGKNVSAGMQYLLDQIGPEGLFANRNSGQYMYGHGIASIALAELYGQTLTPAMRSKLEKVVRLIIASQNRE